MAGKGSATGEFSKLDLGSVALLLDVDGTLIDIGPSPFDVHVPEELSHSLTRLLECTDGALALVSGRPIRDLDRMFSPLELPAIGGHGAEMRLRAGKIIACAKVLPEKMRKQLAQAATPGSGVVMEDKSYSFALHYRQAPQQEGHLREIIAQACAEYPDETVEVLPGKAMFEVKRPGISKGEAVLKLLTQAPFAGRKPIFIGDDVTDESVFAVLPRLNGKGYSVGRHFDGLAGIFATPDDVREALRRLAANECE